MHGIEKSLAGMIRGIGPVYAKKMVEVFAGKVFDIVKAEPVRLRKVPADCMATKGWCGRREDRAGSVCF